MLKFLIISIVNFETFSTIIMAKFALAQNIKVIAVDVNFSRNLESLNLELYWMRYGSNTDTCVNKAKSPKSKVQNVDPFIYLGSRIISFSLSSKRFVLNSSHSMQMIFLFIFNFKKTHENNTRKENKKNKLD